MRKWCARTVCLLGGIFIGVSMAADIPVVPGQLHAPANEWTGNFLIGLEGVSSRVRTAQVGVRGDGAFEFHGVPAGEYLLRVTDEPGEIVCQQFVTIHENMPPIEVRLPERETQGTGAGTVSIKQLMHPPSKKAVAALNTARRLASAGKHNDAVSQLEQAIRISPDFAAAHTNLAVQYILVGRFAESTAESARAIQIGGPDPTNLCNLAVALSSLHRIEEAVGWARAALRLNSGYLKANLLLGSVLVNDPATRREGLLHLEKASAEFDSARQFLDHLRAWRAEP